MHYNQFGLLALWLLRSVNTEPSFFLFKQRYKHIAIYSIRRWSGVSWDNKNKNISCSTGCDLLARNSKLV